ncbi:UNVERIFIED_CONTAM: hypothetical protein PYX00_009204 [Menopon gallinae]|uniref:Uncharacterized protein n=1 Tax=Menopon gallinae TaxID=328185 RepID=A0AAW2HB20_9NEOP
MSPISLVVLLIAPITCHRLIVPPQVETEWDSVIVSSDPIKVTQGKNSLEKNDTGREPDYAIRLNKNTLEEGLPESRSSRNCKYNDISCLYGTETPKVEPERADNQEIIDRFLEQYSSITNAKFGPELNRTDVEEKSYWNGNPERPNHPFEDNKNWVTLETVPWSTSMVSKWQPNVQPTHPSPSSFEPPSQPHRPSEDKPWHYGSMSTSQPTLQTWTTHRPAPVTTNYGSYTPVASSNFPQHKPSSQWGIGNNDIITDNRPTNFPIGNGGYQSFHGSTQNFHSHSPSYQEAQHTMTTHQVTRPTRYPSINKHPSTYPDTGNGEWVLLSTTKGYSVPSGYRGSGKTMYEPIKANHVSGHFPDVKPADISRYHEEDIDFKAPAANRRNLDLGSYEVNEDNKENIDLKGLRALHSENGSTIYAKDNGRRERSDWNMEEAPLQILYSSTNDKEQEPVTLRRKVRLQVLPPASNTTTLSHGGLLEVDGNFHSVDEDHRALEEEKIKQLSKIAKVRRSNFTLYKMVPASVGSVSGKSMRDKSAAVLAAVGAGMIPATMAVLVPMALGRKKRDVPERKFAYNTKMSFN